MAVKWKHDNEAGSIYFCTFTCFDWLPLFDLTNGYGLVYKWFAEIKKKSYETMAYAIMPNHLHTIHSFSEAGFDLNKIISNAKRFMAYEIVDRLELSGQQDTLERLSSAVTLRERKKGQNHKIFRDSFDAKSIMSNKFFFQKLDYLHHNPVSGKWNLASHFSEYEHSSASFYEDGIVKHFQPFDYRDLLF